MSDPDAWLEQARLRVVDDGGATRLRLRGISPPMAIIATALVAIVVGAFAYPVAAMLFHPSPVPWYAVAGYVAAAAAVGIGIAARRRRMIQTGREDLIISEDSGTIRLPWGFGRESDVLVPVDRITEVATAEEVPDLSHKFDASTDKLGPQRYLKRDAHPDDELPPVGARSTMVYAVLVCWRDDAGREIDSPIVRWTSRPRVRGLTFWLRDRLGLDPQGGQP